MGEMMIKKLFMIACAVVLMGAPKYAHAVRCDNDNYYNGLFGSCWSCPSVWVGTVCVAADDENDWDGVPCTDFESGLTGASDGCGIGNSGYLEGENPSINTCRIYAHAGGWEEGGNCLYCDKTGCFTLGASCYYK